MRMFCIYLFGILSECDMCDIMWNGWIDKYIDTDVINYYVSCRLIYTPKLLDCISDQSMQNSQFKTKQPGIKRHTNDKKPLLPICTTIFLIVPK